MITYIEVYKAQFLEILATILVWFQSPHFYAQIGGIVAAWFIVGFIGKFLQKKILLINTPPKEGRLFLLRDMIYRARGLLSPLLLVLVLGAIIPALDAVTGSSWLVKVAQSLALVLALNKAVELFVPAVGLQKIVKFVVLPSALMIVFGVFDQFTTFLDQAALQLGNIRISALFVTKAAIFVCCSARSENVLPAT